MSRLIVTTEILGRFELLLDTRVLDPAKKELEGILPGSAGNSSLGRNIALNACEIMPKRTCAPIPDCS
jgi:hypothetical protein